MPNRKALIVGIDRYVVGRNNLNSCVKDATTFEALLRKSYNFEVRTLHDEEATLASIRQNLDWLFQNAQGDDRLVLYYSAHGYQFREGENLEECLITHDSQFFRDDELASRTKGLPGDVLTCVFDTCHSGGQWKVLVVGGEAEVALTKAWRPTEEQYEEVRAAIENQQVKNFKFFGVPPTNDPAVLNKGFALDGGAADKALGDEQGQLEMRGLLLAACLEDERAVAGTQRTDGLSAYTFFLTKALQELGPETSTAQLQNKTRELLKNQGFAQTPFLKEPATSPGLASRSFLTLQQPKEPTKPIAATPSALSDDIAAAIRDALSQVLKEPQMTTMTQPAPAPVQQEQQKFLEILIPAGIAIASELLKQYQPGVLPMAPPTQPTQQE